MAEILIKNMTLPTEDEQVNITILADGSVIEHFKNESGKWSSYRSGGVKAIELPPHGRLGDLDSIESKIKGKIDDVPKGKDGTRTVKQAFYVNGLLRAKDLVGNSPTVIPASEEPDNDCK